MPNCYADLQMFATRYMAGATLDDGDTAEILRILQGASRRVDATCHRSFVNPSQVRVFDGIGVPRRNEFYLAYMNRNWPSYGLPNGMWLPDLVSASQIAIDQNGDRVYELVLDPATDYYLLQDGADDDMLPPYNRLQLDVYNARAHYTAFQSQPRLVQITGVWGWPSDSEALGVTVTLADATTTQLVASAASDLALGQTLLVEGEQVYLRAGDGTKWTVQRAVNGTTGAAHAGAAATRYTYVDGAREATLATAARMWARRLTGYANVVTNPNTGEIQVFRGVDADVVDMLTDYIRVVM